jgi:short subunit fatty acids transporter
MIRKRTSESDVLNKMSHGKMLMLMVPAYIHTYIYIYIYKREGLGLTVNILQKVPVSKEKVGIKGSTRPFR